VQERPEDFAFLFLKTSSHPRAGMDSDLGRCQEFTFEVFFRALTISILILEAGVLKFVKSFPRGGGSLAKHEGPRVL